ncbi:MAG: ferredoxin, partial [Clostridiales bacterium]|nr:ferredoxin [Clostridiales bacterium]
VNGGGMPHVSSSIRSFENVPAKRAAALYTKDEAMTIRKSHENPAIKKLYEDFFEKPGSHKAHEILHTSYVKRKINNLV